MIVQKCYFQIQGGTFLWFIQIAYIADISLAKLGPYLMKKSNSYPKSLIVSTRLCNFEFVYVSEICLKVEAIEKNNPTKLFKGEKVENQVQGQNLIKRIFKAIKQSKDNEEELSSKLAVVDMTQKNSQGVERQEYILKIWLNKIRSKDINIIPLTVSEVSSNYFIEKQLDFSKKELEMQKKQKRQDFEKRFEQQQQEIKKQREQIERQKLQRLKSTQELQSAFKNNMEGLLNAVTSKINQEILKSSKKIHLQKQSAEMEALKMMRQLKKQILNQKHSKRKSKKERRKEKKSKEKKLKQINKIIELQQNGLELQSEVMEQIERKLYEIKNPNKEKKIKKSKKHKHKKYINSESESDIEIEIVQRKKSKEKHKKRSHSPSHKKSKDKHKDHKHKKEHKHKKDKSKEKDRNQTPQVEEIKDDYDRQDLVSPFANVKSMSKLRNRLLQVSEENAVNIDQGIAQYGLIPRNMNGIRKNHIDVEKIDKEKKTKKRNKKEVQVIQDEEEQFLKRVQELRKNGTIQQQRLQKINRLRLLKKPPQVLQYDEFNPDYNGESRYKPFINFNQNPTMRVNQIFKEAQGNVAPEIKKIPIVFRSQIPSFKSFDIDGNVVRKTGGQQYQQLVFDYPIPTSGTHIVTLRPLQSKMSYIWMGVIDLRERNRQQSYNKKNCISFSLHSGQVVISQKWPKSSINRIQVGQAVKMEINMDTNIITWIVTDGRTAKAPISKTMQKLTLTPYFEMQIDGDEVLFQD